jgi:hypothetical protein
MTLPVASGATGRDSNGSDEITFKLCGYPVSGQFLAKVPRGWILLACIGLLALNLRGPLVAVAPVVDVMQADLGFTPVMLGLLTSIPVLCFALAASLASLAARKLGAEFAVSLTILGVSGLLGIWIAGLTVDSHPRRSLLITTAAIAWSSYPMPCPGWAELSLAAMMTPASPVKAPAAV